MPRLSCCLTAPLYVLSLLQTLRCYTYQTKPLFLTFSELAALEGNSNRQQTTQSLVVRCLEDGIEVVLRGGRSEQMRLGLSRQHRCTAAASGNGDYSIRASLIDCGGHVVVSVMDRSCSMLPPGGFTLTPPLDSVHPQVCALQQRAAAWRLDPGRSCSSGPV